MKKVFLVSYSGGKDSGMALKEIIRLYGDRYEIIPYFADTGWEHPNTYAFVDEFEKYIDIPILRIKSDKYDGFEDMCIQRRGFPNRVRRFCTEELKVLPSIKLIREYQSNGYKVINVVGVRQAESKSRSGEQKWKTTFLGVLPKGRKDKKTGEKKWSKKSLERYYNKNNTVTTLQPIVEVSTQGVYDYHMRTGTPLNPLYRQGFTRVGCFPCIMCNKTEIGYLPRHAVEKACSLEKRVQEENPKTMPVFYHKDGGDDYKTFDEIKKKYDTNTLGFDLGCINHYGICE